MNSVNSSSRIVAEFAPRRTPEELCAPLAPYQPTHYDRSEDSGGRGSRSLEDCFEDVVLDAPLLGYVYKAIGQRVAYDVGYAGGHQGDHALLRRIVHALSFSVLHSASMGTRAGLHENTQAQIFQRLQDQSNPTGQLHYRLPTAIQGAQDGTRERESAISESRCQRPGRSRDEYFVVISSRIHSEFIAFWLSGRGWDDGERGGSYQQEGLSPGSHDFQR